MESGNNPPKIIIIGNTVIKILTQSRGMDGTQNYYDSVHVTVISLINTTSTTTM